jgi:DNA modification methylase
MLLLGDCIEALKTLPDNSVDSVVTDPPYGLEFMGKEWDRLSGGFSEGKFKGFVLPKMSGGNRNVKCPDCGKWIYDHYPRNCRCGGVQKYKSIEMQLWHEQWAREVLRVLKPGGHLLSFGGTRTYHRMACAIEDAGFEIRDQMQWLYGSGFPKSYNISKGIDKMAGAEREVVGEYIRPDGSNARKNVVVDSALFGNADSNDQLRTSPSTPSAIQWDGWGSALKPANEPICVARKPLSEKNLVENVLKWGTGGINIDGCRVESELPDGRTRHGGGIIGSGSSYELPDSHGKMPSGRFPANLILDEEAGQLLDEMSDNASRFFYCAKASRSERNAGLEGMEKKYIATMGDGIGEREHNENEPMAYSQNHHPTVKPISLMRYLCRLVTPPKGTVLDPFMGSGTTGCAASLEGFEFIGIEREPEYLEIAERRMAYYQLQPSLLCE